MKLSCNVIRDLLPLYAENLTSEESNALVDEHLCGCDECAKQLGILKKAQAIPVETDAPGLKKIRKAIVRRRVLAVTMAVMLVITLDVPLGSAGLAGRRSGGEGSREDGGRQHPYLLYGHCSGNQQ